ncbi:MAG: Fe-S cluster assembly protein SufD [Gammaproteobacteria bacterium]
MTEVTQVPEWLTKPPTVNANMPAWLLKHRAKHWDAFLKNGLPTQRNERWKYTDLSFLTQKDFASALPVEAHEISNLVNQHRLQKDDSILLTMVNGYFMPALSDLKMFPDNAIICDFDTAWQENAELLKALDATVIDTKQYPFASLNIAKAASGLFIHLPKDCKLNKPVHLLSLMVGNEELIAHPQHLLMLGENSELTLVEEFVGNADQTYLMNVMTTIFLEKNAQLDSFKMQHDGEQAVHVANKFVYQKQDSNAHFTHFAVGGIFAREDIAIQLQEAGANCKTAGFYRLQRDNQYIDNHVDIFHVAPRSNSEMLYKGILDKKSRAVFNGRLYVERDAQKILAYQANHNLLLSNQAEVYSKPELEIYADDVKCKHGASTGQLDQEALFYLRSRGIPLVEAMNILLRGFSEEVIKRVTHPGVKLRVQEILA